MKNTLPLLCLVTSLVAQAQPNPVFSNLPVGKYPVGFRILTLTDESRVTKRLYHYLGEKETGNRYRQINLHLWYPSRPNSGSGTITYEEYCYAENLSSTSGAIAPEVKTALLNSQRESFQGFFGKIPDADWATLVEARLLARKEATPPKEKFPLLIGTLRPVSTSITNEMLASNGYVVAMVTAGESSDASPQIRFIQEVQDMQLVIAHLQKAGMIDEERIGAFGFSGSGLTPVLLAMHDKRIGALADIESAIYGEGVWDWLAKSNYYDAKNLHVPFLHIYGKKLASGDKSFAEFHRKVYSDRYHLLLNYTGLHHWDVATEGRTSTTVLHVRGEKEPALRASFELANLYLLHFFNAMLRKEKYSQQLLDSRAALARYPDSLWSIQHYPALKPPPDVQQFTEIIHQKGVDTALALARRFIAVDSTAAFVHENALNRLADNFQRDSKPKEALALMNFATEVHPQEAWLWNNLASMHEDFGDKPEARRYSEKVLEVLAGYQGSEMSFNERIRRSAQARIQRLKNQ